MERQAYELRWSSAVASRNGLPRNQLVNGRVSLANRALTGIARYVTPVTPRTGPWPYGPA